MTVKPHDVVSPQTPTQISTRLDEEELLLCVRVRGEVLPDILESEKLVDDESRRLVAVTAATNTFCAVQFLICHLASQSNGPAPLNTGYEFFPSHYFLAFSGSGCGRK
jgi:hypothetical protein